MLPLQSLMIQRQGSGKDSSRRDASTWTASVRVTAQPRQETRQLKSCVLIRKQNRAGVVLITLFNARAGRPSSIACAGENECEERGKGGGGGSWGLEKPAGKGCRCGHILEPKVCFD